jgi:hypothetical protein
MILLVMKPSPSQLSVNIARGIETKKFSGIRTVGIITENHQLLSAAAIGNVERRGSPKRANFRMAV